MTTDTQLANYALAHLGEAEIADISGTDNVSKMCRRFLDDTKREVLRSHRWNCAVKRAKLTQLETGPVHGLDYAYQLPGDLLRLLEVNGEAWEGSEEFFEIERKALVTDQSAAYIRYVALVGVHEMDPLLAEALALKLAAKLAVPLTAKNDTQGQMLALHERAMRKATSIDAMETNGREGRPLERILVNSPLVRSRYGSYPHREFFRTANISSATVVDLDAIFESGL